MRPSLIAFRIRQARRDDLAHLWPLARQLNSYNLLADRRFLARLVNSSLRSFRGQLPKSRAKYLFVLEHLAERQRASAPARQSRIVGCSLIIAKHGTPRLPHLWWDFRRRTLRLGMTTDGPTEVGGLIVARPYRRRPEQLGRQLSYVRFAYMARHPGRFEPELLVEYLPPLTPRGDSPVWQALGRRFTGLSYRAADRLSTTTKTFILKTFPRSPVEIAALPRAARRQLGRVHPAAAGACALLTRIGFRPLHQLEPFDGGPYYGARRRRVTIVRRTRRGRWAAAAEPARACLPSEPQGRQGAVGLVCAEPARGEFRAVAAASRWQGARLAADARVMALLEARPGMEAYVAPLAG